MSRERNDFLNRWIGLGGLILGAVFVGSTRLNPGNTDWLRIGDLAFEQVLWQFARHESPIRWPLLELSSYGEGWGMNLLGGNALLPLILTPIWRLTGFPDQYLGVWFATSVGLQAYWASRLLSRFVVNQWFVIAGSMMFVLSPVLFFRMGWMLHGTLVCQWLILWALHRYFENEFRTRGWTPILVVSLLSNLYIFVMVGAVFLAAFCRGFLMRPSQEHRTLVRGLVLSSLFTVVAGLSFGVASMGGGGRGDGLFRLNALALINPDFGIDEFSSIWTQFFFIRNRTFLWESGEGFAYLGLGAMVAVGAVITQSVRIRSLWRSWLPLVTVSFMLYVIAISNVAAISRREYSYWWPWFLDDFREVFRAAPRFSWLLYYLLMLVGVVSVARIRWIGGRARIAVIFLLVVIQIVDIAPGIATSRRELHRSPKLPSILVGMDWEPIAEQRKTIVFAPTFDISTESLDRNTSEWQDSPVWFQVVWWASERNLTTNFAATARPSTRAVRLENEKLQKEFESGVLRPNSVYVFRSEQSRSEQVSILREGCKPLTLSEVQVVVCD